MAKQQSKKATSGTRNPDRPNGKAWKKPKKEKTRTIQREEKDFLIRLGRKLKKQANQDRREFLTSAATERLSPDEQAFEDSLRIDRLLIEQNYTVYGSMEPGIDY